jgi:hypothetical protein
MKKPLKVKVIFFQLEKTFKRKIYEDLEKEQG